jgi:hypothetical protein
MESILGSNGLQYSSSDSMPEPWCVYAFYLQHSEKRRAEERTRTADLISLRVISRVLQGLHRLANPTYLGGFFFSALPSVAPYCVPGGVRVVSGDIDFRSLASTVVGLRGVAK